MACVSNIAIKILPFNENLKNYSTELIFKFYHIISKLEVIAIKMWYTDCSKKPTTLKWDVNYNFYSNMSNFPVTHCNTP